MKVYAKNALVLVCGTAAAILIAGTVSVTVSRQANATPQYATQTGKSCGQCHENPAGGGKLKAAGEKFKANGYK
jgi:cytochrome c553